MMACELMKASHIAALVPVAWQLCSLLHNLMQAAAKHQAAELQLLGWAGVPGSAPNKFLADVHGQLLGSCLVAAGPQLQTMLLQPGHDGKRLQRPRE